MVPEILVNFFFKVFYNSTWVVLVFVKKTVERICRSRMRKSSESSLRLLSELKQKSIRDSDTGVISFSSALSSIKVQQNLVYFLLANFLEEKTRFDFSFVKPGLMRTLPFINVSGKSSFTIAHVYFFKL